MWWIWILYAIALVLVVFVSNKLANYIDALDKKTKLSGAFLGGILLAGITSLPELVTSFTAAIMNEPELTLGNILGSNVFDIAIIGVLMMIFCVRIRNKTVSKSNFIMALFTFITSAIILVCSIFEFKILIPYVNINVLTPIILVFYTVSLFATREKDKIKAVDIESYTDLERKEILEKKERARSRKRKYALQKQLEPKVEIPISEGDAADLEVLNDIELEPKQTDDLIEVSEPPKLQNKYLTLSLKAIILRFSLLAITLIGISIAITYMADIIDKTYHIGSGLAGALFLGVATSLPEIISSFSLVRLGNFDAGVGNIIGSCMFNFLVIALADIIFVRGTVFLTDLQSIILSACLGVAALMLFVFLGLRRSKLKIKNSLALEIVCGSIIAISYIVFLILSVTIV